MWVVFLLCGIVWVGRSEKPELWCVFPQPVVLIEKENPAGSLFSCNALSFLHPPNACHLFSIMGTSFFSPALTIRKFAASIRRRQ